MMDGSWASRSLERAARFGFVMEQTLGHVTHYTNMRAAIDECPEIRATWYPLPFVGGGVASLPIVRNNWSVRASWQAWQALRQDRADRQFDALFFHTQVTALLSAPLMRRVPSIISLDATPVNYDAVGASYGHTRSHEALEGLKRLLNMRVLHEAQAFVTWCRWARDSLIQDYGVEHDRISVIAPGVNLDLWPAPGPREVGRPLQLLFVGGDFARKGGEILLDAFRHLHVPTELHLVTKSPVASGPGVHVYDNATPNSELLRRLYATADAFVLPTLADCFPLVVQEAMAAGLPVVSTNVGAIGEAVLDGETGLLVPTGDVAALGAAIERLAADPCLRRSMGTHARDLAERQYDSAANARRIVSLMTSMVERRPA